MNPYWRDMANCAGMPLELFFGSDEIPMTNVMAKEGRQICAGCEVRRDCLLDALMTNERNGIRGGLLGHERKQAMNNFRGDIGVAMQAYDRGVFYSSRRSK